MCYNKKECLVNARKNIEKRYVCFFFLSANKFKKKHKKFIFFLVFIHGRYIILRNITLRNVEVVVLYFSFSLV